MKKLHATAIIIAVMAMSLSGQAGEAGKHLFILSGQSNMVRIKPETHFTPIVAKEFGSNNVTVVKSAWNGTPIRSWYSKSGGKGNRYASLVDAVKEATKGKTYETATFVWMQGETDAVNGKGSEGPRTYAESLNGLIDLLKADLKIDSLNIVIGRLSDHRMSENWKQMRNIQVEIAEKHKGAWVDTDDLNDVEMKDGSKRNDLHYTPDNRGTLGKRFAEKAIELIKKRIDRKSP